MRAAAAAGLGWLALYRLHDQHRPPLRLPARRRRPARRRGRGGARRSGCGSTRPAARWTSAEPPAGCRRTGGRGHRRRAGRHRGRRSTATTTRRPTRWCGSRSRRARRSRSPPKLMTEAAELARPQAACGCTPTSPRPSTRRSSAASASAARRSSTPTRWAGSATTSGWRTACTSTTPPWRGSPRPAPASRTAQLQRPARRRHRAGPRPARRRRAGRARRRRRGVATRPDSLVEELRQRLCSARLRGGPAALTAREALRAGHHRRRPVPRPRRRDRLARGGQARRPRAVAARRARPRRHRRPGRRAGVRRRPPPLELLLVGGRPVVERRLAGRGRRRDDAGARDAVRRTAPADAGEEQPMTAPVAPGPHAGRRRRRQPAPAGRHAEGDRRVRVLVRPVGRRHAVGRHAAQPAPARPDPVGIDIGPGAGGARACTRCSPPTTCPGAKRYGLEIADQPVLAIDAGALPGRAGRDRRRRPPGDRAAGGRADRGRLRGAGAGDRRASGAGSVREVHPEPTPVVERSRRLRTTRAATCVRHVPIRRGDPTTAAAGRRGHRRVRGRHAGPGVPRPGVRARGAGRGRRRRPVRRHPVAARRPASRSRALPRAAAGEGAAARWPASAARSAPARTCRCRCTRACWRCAPASR